MAATAAASNVICGDKTKRQAEGQERGRAHEQRVERQKKKLKK